MMTIADTGPWSGLSERLRASAAMARLIAGLGAGERLSATRLPTPAAAWVGDLLRTALDRPLLVVVPNEAEAYAWLEAVALVAPRRTAVYLPAPSLGPFQEAEVSLLVRAEESLALDRIAARAVDHRRLHTAKPVPPMADAAAVPAAGAYHRGR